MPRTFIYLLAVSLCLGSTLKAQAQLGQSDWQVPGQSENQWQPQQQPQQQPQPQAQMGQSDWQQLPPQQQQLGQSDWQRPVQQPQQAQLGQSQWQMPQQNQNWQSPYQNGQATYYGNASTSQAMPQSGNSQYQPPGAYLNQQYGNPQFANNQGKHKREKEHHESHTGETIKGTAAAIGKAVATSASIAAPVMSSYFIGRGIAKGGYYAPYPMMGPGYYGGYYPPYGYGYGNGLSNFMHF